MAVWAIATFSTPNYIQRVALDGVEYVLGFLWSQRERTWTLSISDTANAPLATGIKIGVNVRLIGGRSNLALPPGDLVAFTSDPYDTSPPDLDELGSGRRVELFYLDAAEVS